MIVISKELNDKLLKFTHGLWWTDAEKITHFIEQKCKKKYSDYKGVIVLDDEEFYKFCDFKKRC